MSYGPPLRIVSLAAPWLVNSALLRFTAVLYGKLFPWLAPRKIIVMLNPQYIMVSPISIQP